MDWAVALRRGRSVLTLPLPFDPGGETDVDGDWFCVDFKAASTVTLNSLK
jgi:hypothetical protein